MADRLIDVPPDSSRAGRGSPAAIVRVVDDDAVLLQAVATMLRARGFQVETFSSAEEFLARRGDAPGCVILDLHMPGPGGLELQEAIANGENPLPVIFLSGTGDVPSSVRAMKRGAVDFLTKPTSADDLIAAISHAIRVDEDNRSNRADVREVSLRFKTLTRREREVFALVARGLLNKQIAFELGTTERTVKAHRANVMRKMHVKSVADLVRAAERLASAPPSTGD